MLLVEAGIGRCMVGMTGSQFPLSEIAYRSLIRVKKVRARTRCGNCTRGILPGKSCARRKTEDTQDVRWPNMVGTLFVFRGVVFRVERRPWPTRSKGEFESFPKSWENGACGSPASDCFTCTRDVHYAAGRARIQLAEA